MVSARRASKAAGEQGEAHHHAHHRREREGSGLAKKFAIPVSIAIALMLALLGFVVYGSARDALERQIDDNGVFAAKALAAPDWHNKDNVARLQELLTEDVEEVAIFEKTESGDLQFVISGTQRDKLEISEEPIKLESIGAVQIERGMMRNKEGEKVRYRAYQMAIVKPTSPTQTIAAVKVFLSEENMQGELSGLFTQIIVILILGIVVGVGVAFWVARAVTRPLTTLVHDIDMIAGGNLDHHSRVRSADEIGVLAAAINDMTDGLKEADVMRADLSSKEHEEHITHEIQERLFPSELPQIPSCRVDAVLEAGGEIASDLFDFITLDGNRTGFLLLSASGRGVPAAVILAMARSTFRATAAPEFGPAETLKRMNALFAPDLRRGMYVTAMYAIYDASDASLRMACAGHKVPALRFDAATEELSMYHPGGIAMGLDKGPVFDKSLEEAEIVSNPGDVVILATQGLYELELEEGEPLGDQRYFKWALAAAKTGKDDIASRLAQGIDSKLAEDPGEFDMTIVSLKRN